MLFLITKIILLILNIVIAGMWAYSYFITFAVWAGFVPSDDRPRFPLRLLTLSVIHGIISFLLFRSIFLR